MSQTTFDWDSGKLEVSYEEWATGLRRGFSRRLKSARATSARDSSLWPTATTDPNRNTNVRYKQGGTSLAMAVSTWPTPTSADGERQSHTYKRGNATLQGAASGMWPTPDVPNGGRAMSAEDVAAKGSTNKGKRQVGLENAAKFWPTPKAMSGDANSNRRERGAGGPDLQEASRMWQTPRADGFDAGAHRGSADSLHSQVKLWHAPSTEDHKTDGQHRLDQLDRQAEHFLPAPEMSPAGEESSKKTRRLNPLFVEWLMGVPLGWTSLERLETESYRSWLHTHSALLHNLLTGERAAQLA
jgi:hypothetical protein